MALINELTNIGNAIRKKTGGTELIPLKEMASVIQGISSGIEPIDHTVTFTVDGEPYEIVSVKDGNSVNAPATKPTSDSGSFGSWQVDGNGVTFPYLPTNDIEMNALFTSVADELYAHYGVDKATYPYVLINTTASNTLLSFFTDREILESNIAVLSPWRQKFLKKACSNPADLDEVLTFVYENISVSALEINDETNSRMGACSKGYAYTNHENLGGSATVVNI